MSTRSSILATMCLVAGACGAPTNDHAAHQFTATSGSPVSGSSGCTSGLAPQTESKSGQAGLPIVPPLETSQRCGDGTVDAKEECDDGNQKDGDGCSSSCDRVEAGYSCNPAGKPCHQVARCGDGMVVVPELCDDGNQDGGDGCAANCQLEIGFKCEGDPSECSATVCGDGKREGAESCDDGNVVPFDGCSATCQSEPDCSAGACTSSCGDGIVLDEACDDGNQVDGDGCSAHCQIEPGFTCTEDTPCDEADGRCVLNVPVIYRDFQAGPDFQVTCDALVPGIVESSLDAEGKPVLANGEGACIQSAKSFGEWYRDSARSTMYVDELRLFDNGAGGFVNRYGAQGEPWKAYSHYKWMASTVAECAAAGCVPCDFDLAKVETEGCSADLTTYDGTPVFFPLDHVQSAEPRYRAKIPPQYFDSRWPFDDQLIPDAKPHNFYFTTEVAYWFKYDAKSTAKLAFTGDDDVWVFINGKLAVDLGGLHAPEDGSVTLDVATAGKLGLEDGRVYRISVFHAERKRDGSSFRLTLAGFKTSRSQCTPVCGDNIVSLGEECDDGVNDGGYGQCAPGCKLGEFCGDGKIQISAGENCDDGKPAATTQCSSSCRNYILR